MEFHRVHYLDASVLVKLAVEEHGSKEIEDYMAKEYTSSFYATALCFAEALGVLKAKYLKENRPDHIDQETYLTGGDELSAYVRTGRITLVDVGIAESAVFAEVEAIARTYKLDIVDAYQIVTVKKDYFSRFHDAQPFLVTADRRLAKVAKAEGLHVWHFGKDPSP